MRKMNSIPAKTSTKSLHLLSTLG